MRYRTKSVEVEAIQYQGPKNVEECRAFCQQMSGGLVDISLNAQNGDAAMGCMTAGSVVDALAIGCWVVKSPEDGGTLGIFSDEQFTDRYEPITEEAKTAEPTICPGCGKAIERIMDVVDHFECFGSPANPESVVKPAAPPPPPKPPKPLTADEKKAKEKAEALQKEAVTRRYGAAT